MAGSASHLKETPGRGEDRRSQPPLQVGPELSEWIAGALGSRPGWWIGEVPNVASRLGVPRASAIRFTGGEIELWPPYELPEYVVSPALALALETNSALGFGQLSTHDRAAGNRLYAAALRDILGLGLTAVADACGYEGVDREGTAKKACARGRKDWQRMGAWPWFHFEPGGLPPRLWRSTSLPRALEAPLSNWKAFQDVRERCGPGNPSLAQG